MRIIDIINGPWAIAPVMLMEIRNIYAVHLRGEKIDIAAVEARLGKPLQNEQGGYDLINGTAVIPIEGVLAKRMNLFSKVSGGASTQLIRRDLQTALGDPAVQQIVLCIDSPGGTVDGTFELADFIFENRGKKPIIAFSDGQIHSAAYFIAAACDKVYISGNTVQVGHIGVVTSHQDVSAMQEKMGIKTTEIYRGKYKRIASEYGALTDEGRANMQEKVDYYFTIFVDSIAKYRGVSAAVVLKQMSTEATDYFIGQQAIDAGLVDGVSTLDRLIDDKADGVSAGIFANHAQEAVMTKDEIKAKFPEAYKAIFAEGAAQAAQDMMPVEDCEKTKNDIRKEGAAAEMARIKAVKDQSIPGHEALVETLMFDGVTTGEQAAVKILAAEKTIRGDMKNKLAADAQDVPQVPAAEAGPEKPAAVDQTLPVQERAKAAWDKQPDLRAEFGNNFEAYVAFLKADEAGSVKILGRRN